jgi:hypothetical protein
MRVLQYPTSYCYYEFMKKNNKTVIVIILGLLAAVLLCCASIGALILAGVVPFDFNNVEEPLDTAADYDYTQDHSETEETDITPEDAESEDETVPVDTPVTGTITGSVSYPSEFIPEGMTICAEPDAGTDAYCTTDLIEQTAALPMYELEVPPGDYYIYAYDANGDPDYTAYYSEFVTCGLSVECESHDPILVTVEAGETVDDIDPGDWYDF